MSESNAPTPKPVPGRWYLSDKGEEKARFVLRIGWSNSGSAPMVVFREIVKITGKEGRILTQKSIRIPQYKAWFRGYVMQPEGWEPSWFPGIRMGDPCNR